MGDPVSHCDRGAPVCTALLRVHGSEMAELPLVATPKAIQGLGHCTVLLQLLEGFLAGLGVSALSLPATGSKVGTLSLGVGGTHAGWRQHLGHRLTSSCSRHVMGTPERGDCDHVFVHLNTFLCVSRDM